jgi:hypothetical protein
MNYTNQSTTSNNQAGIWLINAGSRYALFDSRTKALLYAYEALIRADTPTSIVRVGQAERLDAYEILEGWRELSLPLPPAAN